MPPPDIAPTRIIGGIYISSVLPVLARTNLLKNHGITHVVTVMGGDLPGDRRWWNWYRSLRIGVDDVAESNLLERVPDIIRFVDEGLFPEATPEKKKVDEDEEGSEDNSEDDSETASEAASETATPPPPPPPATTASGHTKHRGAVLIHCQAGQSRSAAVCALYLMHKYRLLAKQAVQLIQKRKPDAQPNDGFLQQLEMYEKVFKKSATPDFSLPEYRQWAMEHQLSEDRKPDASPSAAAADSSRWHLRCKKCRYVLAENKHFIPHTKPTMELRHSQFRVHGAVEFAQQQCLHFFVNPIIWMKPELDKLELEGRFICPGANCGAKVGGYKWDGLRCLCGGWVVPGLHVSSSKVDRIGGPPGVAVDLLEIIVER